MKNIFMKKKNVKDVFVDGCYFYFTNRSQCGGRKYG